MTEDPERRSFRQRVLLLSKMMLRKLAVEDMGFSTTEIVEIEGGNDPEAPDRLVAAIMERWDAGVHPGGPTLNVAQPEGEGDDNMGQAEDAQPKRRAVKKARKGQTMSKDEAEGQGTQAPEDQDPDLSMIDQLWDDSVTGAETPPGYDDPPQAAPKKTQTRRAAPKRSADPVSQGEGSSGPGVDDGLLAAIAEDLKQILDDVASLKQGMARIQQDVTQLPELREATEQAKMAAKLGAVQVGSLREIVVRTLGTLFRHLEVSTDFGALVKEAHDIGLSRVKKILQG